MEPVGETSGARRELTKLGHCRTSFITVFVHHGKFATGMEGWDAADGEGGTVRLPIP